MKYFPDDYLARRLSFRYFCGVEQESDYWGFINIDGLLKPKDWMFERVYEAEKIGKAVMEANVKKMLLLSVVKN